MTDRELLEAAARAAGIDIGWIDPVWGAPELAPYIHLPGGKLWNPLTDDGDALRLAVKLGIAIYPPDPEGSVATAHADDADGESHWLTEEGADPYAATRRAIVRAAAAMAKEKP